MNEASSYFWLTILTEGIALLLLFSVIYLVFLKREKKFLLGYVSLLREKINALQKKLRNKTVDNSNFVYELLNETAGYIKVSYAQKYGHSIEEHNQNDADTPGNPTDLKEHFIYVFAYQAFITAINALDNSNTAESTWNKIETNLSSLFEVFKVEIPNRKVYVPTDDEKEQAQQKIQRDLIIGLLSQTIEYIKDIYQEKFGHAIGEQETSVEENNSKEHFLFVFGYQALKAILSALDNSNAPEKAWSKIYQQLEPLIENYRIMPEKEFLTVLEEKVNEIVSEKNTDGDNNNDSDNTEENSNSFNSYNANQKQQSDYDIDKANDDLIIQERKNEIERLKTQINSQADDINALKELLTKKIYSLNDANGDDNSELVEAMEVISNHLRDAEFCISMMEADMQTQDEEIKELKDQLKLAESQNTMPQKTMNADEFHNEILKKEQLIARFSQESKEMLTLIDGMEKDNDEKTKRISELEEIEKRYNDLTRSDQSASEQDSLSEKTQDDSINNMTLEIEKRDKLISRFANDSKKMLQQISQLQNENKLHLEEIESLKNQKNQ